MFVELTPKKAAIQLLEKLMTISLMRRLCMNYMFFKK